MDVWMVEFFLHFFSLLRKDIAMAIEDSHLKTHILGLLNSTYIFLIPKTDKPVNFGDYRPISLCNLLYEVVSKIIVERIKPFLERIISIEQFGFLYSRQILDSITQEGLHSINQKNLDALILKMDLVKAYDRLDWTYLCFILYSLGCPLSL